MCRRSLYITLTTYTKVCFRNKSKEGRTNKTMLETNLLLTYVTLNKDGNDNKFVFSSFIVRVG